jgi:hypothetical protein
MSFRALRAVLNNSRHKRDELLLVVVIADCMYNNTGEANPRIDYLRRKTGMGKRSIYRVLNRLKKGGELQVTSGKDGGCRQANRYRLNSRHFSPY